MPSVEIQPIMLSVIILKLTFEKQAPMWTLGVGGRPFDIGRFCGFGADSKFDAVADPGDFWGRCYTIFFLCPRRCG